MNDEEDEDDEDDEWKKGISNKEIEKTCKNFIDLYNLIKQFQEKELKNI